MSSRRRLFNYLLIGLVTVIFLWFFFRSVNWADTWKYMKQVNLYLLILALFLVPLHLVTRSIRWKYLLRPVKASLRLSKAIEANTLGFTLNFIFPGRLGEIIRPVYLASKEKLSAGYLIGTIVVERAFDIFAMCFLLGSFLMSRSAYRSFYQARPEALVHLYFWGKVGLVLSALLFILISLIYALKDKANKIVYFFSRPFPERIRWRIIAFGQEFIEGLKFFQSWPRLFGYFGLSLVVWLGICFFYWVFFLAYKVNIPFFLSIPYVFLTGVGASIPTPGMAGGYDYFSRLGFTTLYGLEANLAIGLTIVVHSIQLVVTCALGYVIIWKNRLSLFQLKQLGKG
ncbi:MAG: lysylphosphatidylglycerol synthase transmembrane domain-containing protein [Acidobacteriota bacterium]|nr:lysylphosphatidylglycerol synthase transmembrane domain-containing protein [Acidobacteriota bacterium]